MLLRVPTHLRRSICPRHITEVVPSVTNDSKSPTGQQQLPDLIFKKRTLSAQYAFGGAGNNVQDLPLVPPRDALKGPRKWSVAGCSCQMCCLNSAQPTILNFSCLMSPTTPH